jgi:hypothetical protein
MPFGKKQAPVTMKKDPATSATSPRSRDEETDDDGWIILHGDATTTTPMPSARGRPPRPPTRSNRDPSSTATTTASFGQCQEFDPAPDDLVGRYLPARRALRCDALPPHIHDADVYGAHPAFLASVYPAAGNDRSEWFFFACRGRGLGGKRRAGRGAYRLAGEARLGGGARYYCHTFRYHEDDAGGSAARETEWRMDEYGDRGGHDDGPGIDMVVCKVYPARGSALQKSLRARGSALAVKPQVLVQLYLASRSVGDSLRCRMHGASDVFVAHPAILTNVLPAANDQFEWFFVVLRARRAHGDDSRARARRAGPGEYVPVGHEGCVRDGKGRELGYRRVFRYREDEGMERHQSRTAWWMEEYGFRPHFPYGEHDKEQELLVYKVYLRMAHR